MTADPMQRAREGFAPCPTCHQYSHSIGEDRIAEAFMHFQSMFSHRGDGMPTQFRFDERTRDMAQVLVSALLTREEEVRERCARVAEGYHDEVMCQAGEIWVIKQVAAAIRADREGVK